MFNVFSYFSSDKAPLLSADSTDVFERICTELEQLLARLTDVNTRMSQYSEPQMKTPSATYTLQRHRDILKDYSKEFNKTKSNIVTQREREQLLKPSTNALVNYITQYLVLIELRF